MIIRPGGGDAPGAAAFAFIGAPAVIPLGMLTDRVNRTLLLAISLLLWALATGVTGAAISFAMLFGARLFLGVVAATTGPTTPSLVGDLVPSGKRGAAFG
nr:MFS transporter [Chloroflexota bacterium]